MVPRRVIPVLAAVVSLAVGGMAWAAATGPGNTTSLSTEPSTAKPVVDQPSSAGGAGVGVPGVVCPDIGVPVTPSPGGTARHLFTRTTGDGVTIRVYRLADVVGCGPVPAAGESVAPGCSAASVQVEMSDDTAVGQGDLGGWVVPIAGSASSSTSGSPSPTALPATGTFGVIEGDPVWWVGTQVASDVANVSVHFADGTADATSPVDGTVVLAHHVTPPGDPYTVAGTIVMTDVAGNVVEKDSLPTPIEPPSPASPPRYANPSNPNATPEPLGSGSIHSGPVSTSAIGTGGSSSPGGMVACPMIPAGGQSTSSATSMP